MREGQTKEEKHETETEMDSPHSSDLPLILTTTTRNFPPSFFLFKKSFFFLSAMPFIDSS